MERKNKIPLALSIISWVFPKVEKVAPWLAKRWFVKLFFTPLRYKTPYAELEISQKAMAYTIAFEGKKVQVYQWGEGKPVLFVHGWMGRAGQFRKFIPAFISAGYQIVAFDATGHGKSEGKRSHLMEFAEIIEILQKKYEFEMIMGHSLGGVAAMHAIHRGAPVEKLIMISSPAIADKIIAEFLHRLNASEKCGDYLKKYILKKYGHSFETYAASHIVKNLKKINLLLIHDKDDREVGMENPYAILKHYSSAKLFATKGLGHTRILKNDKVIQVSLEFLKTGEVLQVQDNRD